MSTTLPLSIGRARLKILITSQLLSPSLCSNTSGVLLCMTLVYCHGLFTPFISGESLYACKQRGVTKNGLVFYHVVRVLLHHTFYYSLFGCIEHGQIVSSDLFRWIFSCFTQGIVSYSEQAYT